MTRNYVIRGAAPARFAVDYKSALNAEQYAVVTAPGGPVLVVAGAGSGKTRAVTYRVARLIESRVNPSQILLATFTNKAAREMLHRVESLVHSDVRKVWGGTFHSIANRILRRHAPTLGFNRDFTILDSEDARDMLDLSIQESGIDLKARLFPKAVVLYEVLSFANNRGLSPTDCIIQLYPYLASQARPIEQVAAIYRQRKLERNSMDYDDLLINWKRLLVETPEIADYWTSRFEHVLVDEYQDTNKLQAEIIDLLASRHRNIMVVGDDAQSIFAWRGAHFANIYGFKDRYSDCVEYHLETNYRSRPEIVMLANASIRNNVKQFPKALQAIRDSVGSGPGLVPIRSVDQQAAFVASRVLELRQEGVPLDQMAVLYRSHWQSLEVQVELVRRDIPYVVRSGVRFFEQAHIKDVVAYLRIATNPRDELAWKRVLRLIPNIGNRTASRIWEQISRAEDPLELARRQDFVPSRRSAMSWRDFAGLLWRLTGPNSDGQPSRMIETVLASGYEEYLRVEYENADMRAEDLRQLANYASTFASTEAFLSDLALINTERFSPPGGTAAEDVVRGADEDEKLVLSSIHQAKGLEWRAVFLIWASDGKFPSARSLHDAEAEEEERRLFYVAITRAKDELYCCYPVAHMGQGRRLIVQKPSRFITEVPRKLFEVWSVKEEAFALEGSDGEDFVVN
jgi:DNA helicase-2/ATP-dependent DNA helicase PcrA